MYVSLWNNGVEASFSGYRRTPVEMEVSAGRAFNATDLSWPVVSYSPMHITHLKIHQQVWGEAVLECALDYAITGSFRQGDVISIGASSITATLGGMANSFIGRAAEITVETFDAFMEKHPGATLREIWDSAFVAGHQTAHTLLTGEME